MRIVNGDKIWRPDIEFRVQKRRQGKHQHQHKHWNPQCDFSHIIEKSGSFLPIHPVIVTVSRGEVVD